jgi:hypothetical protein
VLLCPHQGAPRLPSFVASAASARHAGAGGARSRAISDRISWNICRGTATSAIWKVTYRPWLTTFAPILISFSRKLVSGHGSAERRDR